MGRVRGGNVQANRKTRPVKSDSDQSTSGEPKSNIERSSNSRPRNDHMALNAAAENQIPVQNDLDSVFDESGWGYCTVAQLEELLLENLEEVYYEAIDKIMSIGYSEVAALKAVLRNGLKYSGVDYLTTVVHNALDYLSKGGRNDKVSHSEPTFTNLRDLEKYTLARMVGLLQKSKPHLTKGDAMCSLYMSDFNMGRASAIEIPDLPSLRASGSGGAPPLPQFHGGWGFGNSATLSDASKVSLQREIQCPKRFNLSPAMKSLLKRNVAMFAEGFRANANMFHSQTRPCPNPSFGGNTSNANGAESQEVISSLMSKFQGLNLEESNKTEQAPLDQKDGMILNLVHQIKDLEKQVKERKEWAQEKAMQAARKLSNDFIELKKLRMERDEAQRLKGKEAHDEATMKTFKEIEYDVRRASAQADRASNTVKKLENENAELRAEMEASKLSASESVSACVEITKREKKHHKRLLAWEKQKAKLQEEIAVEKGKIEELNLELARVEAATKETEAKWKEEKKEKEQFIAQVEEERRLKEASEASNRRELEALRLNIQIDIQRHKDDLQRLEEEYARLQEQSSETQQQSNDVWTNNANRLNPQGESIERLLHALDQMERDSRENVVCCNRACMICNRHEVSVVFLPCAHQVICAHCNESHGRNGRALCPCCGSPIEQRICVYGASS